MRASPSPAWTPNGWQLRYASSQAVDILFVNAGVALPAPLEAVDDAHIDTIFDSNFKGAVFAIQKAVPLMERGGSVMGGCAIFGGLASTNWTEN